MDAPPTQYKVIERGRKLIVLDTATNLPPKQACDLHPTGHGLQSREDDADAPRQPSPSPRPEQRKQGLASVGWGAFGFAMIVAIMIGGLTGFLMAAAAIIIAGNIALKRYGKRL